MKKKDSLIKSYIPEIEGLRGFAIINVIIYHLNPNILPGGFLGVDIFFVISGFLIMASIQKGIKESNFRFIPFIKNFYNKRFKRIFPTLIVYFLIFFLITLFLDPNPGIPIRTGASSLFGISNLYLGKSNLEYFGHELSSNPFLITWSLSLEIQFYILFPILIFLIRKFFSIEFLKLILIFLTSFSAFYFLNNQEFYFSPLARIWGIIIGSLAYLYSLEINSENLLIKKINLNLVVASIILTTFVIFKYTFINHFIVVIFSSILLISNFKKNSIISKVFKSKFLMKIGKRSYSLFLWHWGLITFFFWAGINFNIFTIFLYFGLTLIFSELNYKYVEKPFLSKIKFKFKKYLVLLFLTITPLTLLSALKNRYKLLNIASNFTPELNRTFQYVESSLSNEDEYFELIPKLYRKNHDSRGIFKPNKKTVFLIGDSHVANHIPSFLKATYELEKSFSLIKIKSSFFSNDSNRKFTNYKQKVDLIMKLLRNSIDNGDILIFATDFNDLKDKTKNKLSRVAISEMRVNLKKITDISKDNNSKLLLIDLLPIPCLEKGPDYFNPKGDKFLEQKNNFLKSQKADEIRKNCDYPIHLLKEYRIEMTKIYKDLSVSHENVEYLDFSEELCKNKVCSPIDINNQFIYVDQSPHISLEKRFILKDKWKEYLNKFL